MANPAKRKGDRFELELSKYLHESGTPAVRQHDGGSRDTGDLWLPPFLIEAKNYANTSAALRDGMSDALRAVAMHHPDMIPAVAVKRPGYPITAAYFVVPVRFVPDLLRHIRGDHASGPSD
jgi:hypothetical protein